MDELEADKLGHGFVGASIYSLARLASMGLGADPDTATMVGLLLTLAAGVGKEVYDGQNGGDVELADAVWTMAGAGMGFTAGFRW